MKIPHATLIAFALVTAGCASQVPVAETYPVSYQKKMKASHHWDVLAADVVAQTKASLKRNNYLDGRELYVVPAEQKTAFNRAFGNFLTSQLVNQGLPVSTKREGSVVVQYETQLVKHNSERPNYAPGMLTTLTAGVLVARDVALHASGESLYLGGMALVGLADLGYGRLAGGPTKTEVIVTTSITDDGHYLARKSDVYYLEDVDASLFVEAPADVSPVKELKVVGQ
jgi:hypothetical protein